MPAVDGYSSYPGSYWDCVTPTSPASSDTVATAAINSIQPSSLLSLLDSNHIEFLIISDYAAWLQRQDIFTTAYGYYGASQVDYHISAVFDEVDLPEGTITNNQFGASAVHEMGHQLDHIFNSNSGFWSNGDTWQSDYNIDIVAVNSLACTAMFYSSTCSSSTYSGMTNWEIFQAKYSGCSASEEIFACIFEHQESLTVGGFSAAPQLEMALSAFSNMNEEMEDIITFGHP